MAVHKAFVRSVDRVNDFIGRTLPYLIIPMSMMLIIEVFLRYFFLAPTIWANELTQLTFGVYSILSGGPVLLWKGHVNVDLIYMRLSTKGKAVVDIASSFIFFAFALALIYGGLYLAWDSISILERKVSTLATPIYPFKIAIAVGAILLTLQGIAKLVRDILTLLTKNDVDI